MKSSYLKLLLLIVLPGFLTISVYGQEDTSRTKAINVSKPDLPKWGEDSAKCVKNFSLYREYYKNYKKTKDAGKLDEAKDYMQSAIQPWRWVFNNCPVASQNIYRDGAEIIKYLYNNTEDEYKPAYADTLMNVYDQRLEMYGWKEGVGYILGRKAVDHMKYKKGHIEESFKLFEKSFNYVKEDNYIAPVLYYHLYSAINMFRMGKADKDIIVRTYDKVITVYENAIDNKVKNYESFENLKPRIEQMFDPFADCEDLNEIFNKRFKENPEDLKLLKRISSMLNDKGCTESDLYFNATRKLHSLEPSAESAFLMGKMSIKREMFNDAENYLKQAATLFKDSTKINEAYYLLANVNNAQGKRSSARTNALKALDYKPDDGRCYILIGDLYANSASVCKSDNKVESKSIYWAAVDKYQKAKSVDPDVAEKAQQKINKFSQYFPTRDELFFENYNPGDKYTVGCWINETTIIRQK